MFFARDVAADADKTGDLPVHRATELCGEQPADFAVGFDNFLLAVDDRLSGPEHGLVIGEKCRGNVVRKEVKVSLADGSASVRHPRLMRSPALTSVFRASVSLA